MFYDRASETLRRYVAEAETPEGAQTAVRTLADEYAAERGSRDGFSLRANFGVFDEEGSRWLQLPRGLR